MAFIRDHLGVPDFEALVRQYILTGQETQTPAQQMPPQIQEALSRVAALEEALKQRELQEQQRQATLQQEQARQNIRAHVGVRLSECEKTPDEFELVLSNRDEAANLYLNLYAQAWKIAGRELEPDECQLLMRKVESHLVTAEQQRLERARGTKRFGSLFAPKQPEQAEQSKSGNQPSMRTLTNEQGRPIPVPKAKPVDPEEMRARRFAENYAKAAAQRGTPR